MKNFRKNVLKSRNGITLIALVITIIVLLILAGISIAMLSGENSIIKKASDAKTTAENGGITERAQTSYLGALAAGKGQITQELFETELDKEFGENGYELTTDDATDEWVVKVEGQERYRVSTAALSGANEIKFILVEEYGHAYIVKGNGNVYKVTFSPEDPYSIEYISLKDATIDEIPILTNVKKLEPKQYYISKSNELYLYDYSTETYEKIAENVKEYDGCYVTTSNELYGIGSEYNEQDEEIIVTKKIADNVVSYYNGCYLTTSNELYCYYYDYNQDSYISRYVATNVKEFVGDSYITTSNELFTFDVYTQISTKVADNVKTVCDIGYITTSNELYKYDRYYQTSTKELDNIKEYWSLGYYLTTSNELHKRDYNYSSSTWTDELVNTNVIYYFRPKDKSSSHLPMGLEWYKLSSGDIYLLYSSGGG